jgi:hypothetical protein
MIRAAMMLSETETAKRASDEEVSMARMIGSDRPALKPLFDIISERIIYWRAAFEQFRPIRNFILCLRQTDHRS